MAITYNIFSKIVPAEAPNFSAHTYTQIYGGSLGCSPTINQIPINIGPSSSINIAIRTISNGSGCFLLGHNIDVYTGSINAV